jgi:4'-phosphopantetheinyl transferase
VIAVAASAVVWLFDAAELEGSLPLLERFLSTEEREKARRFVRPDVGRTCAIARGTLRWLLGAEIGCRPEEVAIVYNEFGKPELCGGAGPLFNVSHSEGRIAIALGFGAPVGIDIERVRPGPEWPDLSRRYFAPREAEYIESLNPEQRNQAFFEIWTRKEAYVKAQGRGLSIPLDAFCVPLGPMSLGAALVEDGTGLWQAGPLATEGEFVGAWVAQVGTRVEQHRRAPAMGRALARSTPG